MALVPFYTDFCFKRFRKSNGEPLKKRALQKAAKRLGLDKLVIRGGGEPLIDDELAYREMLQNMPAAKAGQARRGRPRTTS